MLYISSATISWDYWAQQFVYCSINCARANRCAAVSGGSVTRCVTRGSPLTSCVVLRPSSTWQRSASTGLHTRYVHHVGLEISIVHLYMYEHTVSIRLDDYMRHCQRKFLARDRRPIQAYIGTFVIPDIHLCSTIVLNYHRSLSA